MRNKNAKFVAVVGMAAMMMAGCFEKHGSFDLEEQSAHDGARVAVRGKPVVVPAGKIHYGDVVVVDGKADVQGEVRGSVVVIAGDLRVGPKAHISEDLVGVGNHKSEVAAESRVQGERVFVHWSGVQWFVDTTLFAMEHPLLVTMTACISFLVLCLLAWLLVIRPYDPERFHYTVAAHPVRAGLLGMLAAIAVHVLIVIAFFSRWGVGLVPVLGLLLVVMTVLGWVVIGGHVGRWLARKYNWKVSPFLYGLIGVCVVMVSFSLPVVGQLATLFASWIGMGALLAPKEIPEGTPPPEPPRTEPEPAPMRKEKLETESTPVNSSAPAEALNGA